MERIPGFIVLTVGKSVFATPTRFSIVGIVYRLCGGQTVVCSSGMSFNVSETPEEIDQKIREASE